MATLGLEPPLDCRNGGVSCPSHPQFSRQNYCCICIIICKHMSIIYIHIQYNIYVTCYEKQCILLHYKMLSLSIYIYIQIRHLKRSLAWQDSHLDHVFRAAHMASCVDAGDLPSALVGMPDETFLQYVGS